MQGDAQDPGQASQPGLFESFKKIASTLLGIGRTRLELLSAELEEEWERMTSLLIWTLIALFCAAVGVVFATLLLVVIFWDTNRVLVLGILALVFFIAAAVAWNVARIAATTRTRLFSASLAELAKDRERLTPSHEYKADQTH